MDARYMKPFAIHPKIKKEVEKAKQDDEKVNGKKDEMPVSAKANAKAGNPLKALKNEIIETKPKHKVVAAYFEKLVTMHCNEDSDED